MNRRRWLAVAGSGMASLLTLPRPEAAVNPSLYFDTLNDEAFPELLIEVGRKGLNARVLTAPGDPRVPAPKASVALLVTFRLDEPPPRRSAADVLPGWVLSLDQPDAKGVLQRRRIDLAPRPLMGDFVEQIPPRADLPQVPGMIYRGAWWADLSPLYQQKLLRPGLLVELSYGQQASTRLTLP